MVNQSQLLGNLNNSNDDESCWMHSIIEPFGRTTSPTTRYGTLTRIIIWPLVSCPTLPARLPPLSPTATVGLAARALRRLAWIWLICSKVLCCVFLILQWRCPCDIQRQWTPEVLCVYQENLNRNRNCSFSLKTYRNQPMMEILEL